LLHADLEAERKVSSEEGQGVANKWGASFIETSAKTQANIGALFLEMIRLILKDRGVGGEEEAEPWFLTPPPAF
jgi:GTPase SAR1 family protein